MVYMHGGGWVLGNHMTVDPVARALVKRSGCAMLSIDYRLAPEQKFPAALEDVINSLRWVMVHADEWGLDPGRIAVGGDSSGANLAAAAALHCRDKGDIPLVFQLLVYPALDHNYETDSYTRFGNGEQSALSRADVVWFHNHYVTRPEELDSPFVSPLRAHTLAALPRTLLICAELDPLLDDSIAYAQRLRESGVSVDLQIYTGMFHGFWRMPGVLTKAREAIGYSADQMRDAMNVVAG
jgi:acetyl esterase